MPHYANQSFRYGHYEDRLDADERRGSSRRSQRANRRRSRKRTATLTVNGRRNKRWSW